MRTQENTREFLRRATSITRNLRTWGESTDLRRTPNVRNSSSSSRAVTRGSRLPTYKRAITTDHLQIIRQKRTRIAIRFRKTSHPEPSYQRESTPNQATNRSKSSPKWTDLKLETKISRGLQPGEGGGRTNQPDLGFRGGEKNMGQGDEREICGFTFSDLFPPEAAAWIEGGDAGWWWRTELGPGESSWAKARRRDEITRREDVIALPGWDWTGQFRNQDFWLDPE